MKFFNLTFLAFLLWSVTALSDTASTPRSEAKESAKKERKKKVEICQECGKPEPECECHESTEKSKADKKASKSKND